MCVVPLLRIYTKITPREFKPLLGGGFISGDELLMIEIPWIKVLEALPPTFQRRKYGL